MLLLAESFRPILATATGYSGPNAVVLPLPTLSRDRSLLLFTLLPVFPEREAFLLPLSMYD